MGYHAEVVFLAWDLGRTYLELAQECVVQSQESEQFAASGNGLASPPVNGLPMLQSPVTELPAETYRQLRVLAGAVFREEQPGHTLQPTAVLHEALVKLNLGISEVPSEKRHFFALVARAMRQVLIDHARARRSQKRGGGQRPFALDTDEGVAGLRAGNGKPSGNPTERTVDAEMIAELVDKLDAVDPAAAEVLRLRSFAGLAVAEIAAVMGCSVGTVEKQLRFLRAWLTLHMQ
jgi:RNA polymerase sigma factor (TIGR02999 family)